MPLIDILIVVHRYVRFYWYVQHRRIASTTSAFAGHLGVPCGALWLYSEALHDCSFYSVLTRMVSDALLAIVAICGVFCLCCIFHGQSVLSAGRRRLHFALLRAVGQSATSFADPSRASVWSV